MDDLKKEMLKLLKKEMMMSMKEKKRGLFEGMLPSNKEVKKVTVMADSDEGLKKGLSKAEEIMKAKLGDMEESEDEEMEDEEYECEECKGKEECECED
jgi:hypothetical protein